MKTIMKHIYHTIRISAGAFLLLLILSENIYSQSTNLSYSVQKHLFLSVNLNPVQTSLITKTDSLKGLKSTNKNGMGFSIEAGYFFSKYLGVSAGVGLQTCGSQFDLDSYKKWYGATDSEGDQYNRLVSGSAIKETQKITFLTIPVTLRFQIPFNEKFGIFLNPGLTLLIPFGKSYSGTGTFSYGGYYPAYDIFMTDVDWEGFQSNQSSNVSGKLDLKSMIPSFSGSAGIQYVIKDNLKITLGILSMSTLGVISDTKPVKDFRLSEMPNTMNSISNGGSSAEVKITGINISLVYLLK